MFIYCICTQYLVGAPFALITASIQRGMEVVKFVALLRWYVSPGFFDSGLQLIFFGLLFLIFLLTIPHRFSMGFRSGEFGGQSSTQTPWSFNQLLVILAVWAASKSCWKMKSASLKSWSAEGPWFPNEIQNLLSSEEDLEPLGNSPVLLLLSPGKTHASDDNCSQIP